MQKDNESDKIEIRKGSRFIINEKENIYGRIQNKGSAEVVNRRKGVKHSRVGERNCTESAPELESRIPIKRSDTIKAELNEKEAENDRLYKKVGQLTTENDWLKKNYEQVSRLKKE